MINTSLVRTLSMQRRPAAPPQKQIDPGLLAEIKAAERNGAQVTATIGFNQPMDGRPVISRLAKQLKDQPLSESYQPALGTMSITASPKFLTALIAADEVQSASVPAVFYPAGPGGGCTI